MKIYKDSKGFGTLEALLVVLALVLIGGAGWYVYNKNQESKNDSTTASKNSAVNNKKEVNQNIPEKKLSDDWLLRESSEASIRVPDGFEILVSEDEALDFFVPGTPEYQKGVKARVVGEPDKHFELGVMVHWNGYGWNRRGAEVKKFQTHSGLDVAVNEFIQTNEPDGLDFAKGTTLLEYTISNGENFVSVQYAYQGSGIVDIIDEMVRTADIN